MTCQNYYYDKNTIVLSCYINGEVIFIMCLGYKYDVFVM